MKNFHFPPNWKVFSAIDKHPQYVLESPEKRFQKTSCKMKTHLTFKYAFLSILLNSDGNNRRNIESPKTFDNVLLRLLPTFTKFIIPFYSRFFVSVLREGVHKKTAKERGREQLFTFNCFIYFV